MAEVLVFQHHFAEVPGTLGDLLASHGHGTTTVRLDLGEVPPPSMRGYGGLVIMGGPMSANQDDRYPWLRTERSFIRDCVLAGIPTIGHCLGAQLIAKALGGEVCVNPSGPEIGWWPVTKTTASVDGHWLDDLPERFEGFHWHGETFTLPEGAVPLLSSDICAHQTFSVGDHCLALQWHPEVTERAVRVWVEVMHADLLSEADGVQSAQVILDGVGERCVALARWARLIYTPWILKIA